MFWRGIQMNTKLIRRLKKSSIIVCILYVIMYYILILLLPKDMKEIASDIWSPVGGILSLLIIGYSIKCLDSNIYRKIWVFYFLGNLSFLFGDLAWLYFEILKGIGVQYPSIADFFYILTPMFYFVASIKLLRLRGICTSIRSIFDVIILMILAATLEWELSFNNLTIDSSPNILYKIVSVLCPASDLALLFLAIFMYLNYYYRDKNNFHSKTLIAAPILWAFADHIYLVKSSLGVYISGDLVDPLWMLGLLLVSIGSIYNVEFYLQSYKPKDDSSIKYNGIKNYINVIFPYVGVISLLAATCKHIKLTPLVISAYSSILLIIFRQIFILIDNRRILDLLYKTNSELEDSKKKLEKINSELVQANLAIEQEARTDFLTKLYNRRFTEKTLEDLIEKCDTENLEIILMILDIDYFKKVNDIYGHEVGDIVLRDLASIIKNTIKSDGVVGRWGGEEFLIIKPVYFSLDDDIIKESADRIRRKITSYEFLINNNRFSVTVSIGVTKWLRGHDNKDLLIKRADNALYEAKNTGRNRVVLL